MILESEGTAFYSDSSIAMRKVTNRHLSVGLADAFGEKGKTLWRAASASQGDALPCDRESSSNDYTTPQANSHILNAVQGLCRLL